MPAKSSFSSVLKRKKLTATVNHTTSTIKGYYEALRPHPQPLPHPEGWWAAIDRDLRDLAVFLLCFAMYNDLEACIDLPIIDNFPLPNKLTYQLQGWDGMSTVYVEPAVWFKSMCQLIGEDPPPTSDRGNTLISRRGWSTYVNTFGLPDPALIEPGSWVARQGVLCRYGVRKRRIFGEAAYKIFASGEFETCADIEPVTVAKSLIPVKFAPALTAQPRDSYLVRLCFRYRSPAITDVVETGHRELSHSLSALHKTQACSHDPTAPGLLRLDADSTAVKWFYNWPKTAPQIDSARLWVLITTGDKASRWYNLWWLKANGFHLGGVIIIRTNDYCVPCAITQASQRP